MSHMENAHTQIPMSKGNVPPHSMPVNANRTSVGHPGAAIRKSSANSHHSPHTFSNSSFPNAAQPSSHYKNANSLPRESPNASMAHSNVTKIKDETLNDSSHSHAEFKSNSRNVPHDKKGLKMQNSGAPSNKNALADPKKGNLWGSLAQGSSFGGQIVKPNTEDTFELFRKQAKEKEIREKQLKQVQQQEQVRKRFDLKKEESEEVPIPVPAAVPPIDKNRKHNQFDDLARHVKSNNSSPASDSNSPSATANSISDRDRQRQREQERRRREAMTTQIDMNRQSDIMANFEEML